MKQHLLLLLALSLTPLTLAGEPGGKEVMTSGKVPCVEAASSCLTYDFLDLQYQYSDFDGLDVGHGVALNLSKALFGHVYLTATTDWTRTGWEHTDIDAYSVTAGLGYYVPVTDRFHLNIEAGALFSDLESDYGSSSEWGGAVGPGFRYCLTEQLELFGNAYYTAYEGGFDIWDFNAGIIYDVTKSVGLKFSGLFNEEGYTLLGGIRIYY
ncbi:MAG TPA: YfaZ family outer membrane protein [Verrucomicrobiales bacterium]|nr:YfaZ family outer membrane protein [Verrucomicrobiales bacterium]